MIKKEMITQKGNKITFTAEVDLSTIILKMYNNGQLVAKSDEKPSEINEVITINYNELVANGICGTLNNAYLNKEMYDLATEVYQKAEELQKQVMVKFSVTGRNTEETIDTRKNIEEQLQFIAKKYNVELRIVKESYQNNQESKQETINQDLENAKATIARAEQQKSIMTDTEYQIWAKNYNDIYNEGEKDGYIPRLVTVEQLKNAKEIIKKYS